MGILGLVLIFIGVGFLIPAVWDKSIGMGLAGALFLCGGVTILIFAYKLTAVFNRLGDRLNIRTPIGTISACVGNLFIIYLSVPLFFIEKGESVRPMGAFGLSFITATLMLAVSLPLVNLIDKRISRRWEIIGKVLCLFPCPYIIVGWHIIAMIQGFSCLP